MKKTVRAKIHWGYIALALAVAMGGFAGLWLTRRQAPTLTRRCSLPRAERMQWAEEVLLGVVEAEGIAIEETDLNGTGLIGPEWTPLTTTSGLIEAKRTSLDPNFAALLVRYFQEAGLKAGDHVAVGASGSFPGLLIATLCAATEMELDVDVIASFGASMHGATRTELNICRIMRILRENGVVDYDLLAVSPGGDNDYGESLLFPEAREVIAALAAAEGVSLSTTTDLEKSIARRLELFGEDVGLLCQCGRGQRQQRHQRLYA